MGKRRPERPYGTASPAAVTRGDSDSIACLAGAFAGAHRGLGAWPQSWIARIEYRGRLAALGDLWDNRSSQAME
jgi:ADP-ribosylglycohydrolase